jgi:replication-associated recombination protein RarA
MSFKEIKGNRKTVERMSRAIMSRNINHAYLLEGDRTIDKLALAENFVKAILCRDGGGDSCGGCPSCVKISHGNHEDVIYLAAEGNSIKDEAVEGLQSRLKKKPYVGDRNIAVIQDADTMTLRAQNRLLKTLEEPAPGTVIVLLSENMENLTQTILSRCVIFRLNPFETPEYEDVLEGAVQIADMVLAGKPFYEIVPRLAEYTAGREAALEFLDAMESWYRDLAVCGYDSQNRLVFHPDRAEELRKRSRLYQRSALDSAVSAIEEAKNDLNRNLNTSYTMKKMILKIIA